MTVDLSISAKMLFNLIKIKAKTHLNYGFYALKNNIRNNSYIDIINTTRSNPTKLSNQSSDEKYRDRIGMVLVRIVKKKLFIALNQMKIYSFVAGLENGRKK